MDMTDIRPELHVAQQSRRDKLRDQQMNDFMANTLENALVAHHHHHHHHNLLNPDFIQVRSIRNAVSPSDQVPVPGPGLIGFSQSHPVALPVQTDVILAYQDCTAMSSMNNTQAIPSSADLNAAIKEGISDPQGCSNWKPIDSSQLSCDNWSAMHYVRDQAAGRANNNVGEVLSNNFGVVINDGHILDYSLNYCTKQNYEAGQDIVARSGMTSSEISGQDDNPKCHMNLPYQNSLQNLVTVACSGTRSNELVFLPSYGTHQQPDSWLSRRVGDGLTHHWTRESVGCGVTRECNEELKSFAADSSKQALSLSLSPEIPKPSIIGKSSGKLLHDIVGGGGAGAAPSVNLQRQVGPLGPFTGYATILKSSRFLKPAQELLDDFCNMCVSKIASRSKASIDLANAATHEDGGGGKSNVDSGMLSSPLRSSDGAGSCSSYESFKPENHEKKAKLLFLLEEVSRRYKLYNQQMQMVMSSFESVAGLSTATPYISLALKRITGSFRSIRAAISDQLKMNLSKSLGNDNYTGTNSTSNTRLINDGFQKARSLMGSKVAFLEQPQQHQRQQQQHVWRPQRGLPERAVAILRGWLFDHFLHPYPTDTDKQMLATQTGLSRNQVSNWFINARVRLWKPMVEEIHMLESRAMAAEAKPNTARTNFTTNNKNNISDQPCNNNVNGQQEPNKQVMEFSGTSLANNGAAVLDHQKRSRLEFARGHNEDVTGFTGFMPYNQRNGGFERGLGSVSLTLGLRHGVDSVQKQQSQSQDHHQFGGGQVVHDFVG